MFHVQQDLETVDESIKNFKNWFHKLLTDTRLRLQVANYCLGFLHVT